MMSASEWQPPQSYNQEAVQEILYLAITRKSDQGELSREQLWEIAAELNIDGDSLQAAERDWLNHQLLERKRQEFDVYRREQFRQKVIRYFIVSAFLISFDLMVAGALTWSRFVLLVWGLVISLNAWKTFQTKGEAYEQAFQRWNLKNEMKESLTSLWKKIKKAWQA
jgi:hypothetical protein